MANKYGAQTGPGAEYWLGYRRASNASLFEAVDASVALAYQCPTRSPYAQWWVKQRGCYAPGLCRCRMSVIVS
jgi:hypothetical protein